MSGELDPLDSNAAQERLIILERQTEKILAFQKISYRWQLQHHQNVKLIIGRLNELGKIMMQRGLALAPLEELVPFEDRELMPPGYQPRQVDRRMSSSSSSSSSSSALAPSASFPSSSSLSSASASSGSLAAPAGRVIPVSPPRPSFHRRVLAFRNTPYAKTLSDLIRAISGQDFESLTEESTEIALINVAVWIESEQMSDRQMGLLFLIEALRRFPSLLGKPENEELLRLYTLVVESCLRDWKSLCQDSVIDKQEIAAALSQLYELSQFQ